MEDSERSLPKPTRKGNEKMLKTYIICSILMHFTSGALITYLYYRSHGIRMFVDVQERRIIELNKENSKLQQVCRAFKAKKKTLRSKT